MLPADEARQTLEFDDHFIIEPSFRPWTREEPAYATEGKRCSEGFCYASDNNPEWLTVDQLRQLIGSANVTSVRNLTRKAS
jgi:UDP-N-acetylglucosamine 4,6-dehydratase